MRKRYLLPFIAVLILLLGIVSCQSKLIYFPRPYEQGYTQRWQQVTQGKVLSFQTSQGKQQAYLLGSQNQKSPERLWLVCGGNGTLAGDWTTWMRHDAPKEDAYLLIDYPGYGDNQGSPTPQRIRENIAQALPLAAKELSWSNDELSTRTRFFGHSLGCAAALQGSADHGIHRGVLLSPFTSAMDMAKEVTGMSIGFLVVHRFDNKQRISEIAGYDDSKIEIFHGQADPIIPFTMSQQLQAIAPQKITLDLITNGGHNNLTELASAKIVAAMRAVR
jgi:pimeloyl-ACP methyl ester carboxylesterase